MSGGGGGIVILKNAKATFQDPSVQALTPHKFWKIIAPIIAKEYDAWTLADRMAVFSVLNYLGISVAVDGESAS